MKPSPVSGHGCGLEPAPLVRAVADVRAGLRRQWWPMLKLASGMLMLAVIGLLLCPRKYLSESKLLVRIGRESMRLDPTATLGQTFAPQESRESEVTSVLDLLHSRVLREKVVETVGVDVLLKQRELPREVVAWIRTEGTPPADLTDQLLAARRSQQFTQLKREKAVRRLSDALRISQTKKSNVIAISCRAHTPEVAQVLLTLFVGEFRRQYLLASHTSGSFEFFAEQTNVIGEEFEQADRELQQARNELVAVSVERRRNALQSQLNDVESSILQTQAALATSEATLNDLRSSLKAMPRKSLTQEVTGFPNDAIGLTRRQLYELEIREKDLLSRYTARHPLVVAVQDQKTEALRILKQRGGRKVGQETLADDPAWKELNLKLLAEQSNAEGLRARIWALDRQHEDLRQQLARLNSRAGEVARLVERVELLRAKYASYAEKREQGRIDQALLDEEISSLNVAQPPTYIVKPVSPRKGITLLFAGVLAVAAAVSLAIVRECFAGTPAPWRHFASAYAQGPVQLKSPDDEIAEVSRLVEQAIH